MTGEQRMRTVEEHLAQALALVSPLPSVELPLTEALGRWSTHDLSAGSDQPRWDNSAMDGYAVRASDTVGASSQPVRLRVIADLPAGSAQVPVVVPGTAARIMTGAPLPPGADAIVPVEATHGRTGAGLVSATAVEGAHTRRSGADLRAGDLVVAAHTRLGARQLAAIASVGTATVRVHRRPVVAVVSTGSELVPAGSPLRRGQIPDSNSVLLASALLDAGCLVRRVGGVADDPAELARVLGELDGTVDLVVTSGGVSMGAYEVVREVLGGLSSMAFVQVAMQPGKPQGIGTLAGGTPVLCLPGNPVSAFVSFEVFVRPVVERLDGRPGPLPAPVRATVDDEWRTPPGRVQYMPVILTGREPDLRVRRAVPGGSGSHLVAGLARADGLALVPADVERVRAGDQLDILRTP
jgi:molybdopterin molybdotransferase